MARKPRHDIPPEATKSNTVAVSLTDRDHEVLTVLTLRVRAMTIQQIATVWWTDIPGAPAKRSLAEARRRLQVLARDGLVEITALLAHPEIELIAPLAVWQPGLPPPDIGSVAHAAKSRWSRPHVTTEFVTATVEAGRLMGGEGGRQPKTSEASHDMHLAAVYLRMRRELRTRSENWRSEARVLAEQGRASDKLPDALVRDGKCTTAIEFVGEYSAAKLAAFHEYCNHKNYGYELW